MEAIQYKRRTDAYSTMLAAGFRTHSTLFALMAPSAEEESRILNLPAFALYRKKLQDAQGRVYFTPGIHRPGDPNHPIRP